MKKLLLLPAILALLFCGELFALNDTESRFYNETAYNGVNRNIVSYYGAKTNDGQDDTGTIQNAINKITNLNNGGRIYFPDGTCNIKEVTLKNNVHLVSHKNAIIKLPANDNPWGGVSRMNSCRNVSIRGDGGRFTVDLRGAAYSELCFVVKVTNAENLLIDNMYVIENYTAFAAIQIDNGIGGIVKRVGETTH